VRFLGISGSPSTTTIKNTDIYLQKLNKNMVKISVKIYPWIWSPSIRNRILSIPGTRFFSPRLRVCGSSLRDGA
jgi:hypothetical protein